MGYANIQVAVDLTQFSCGCCGGVYAINERVREHHEKKGTYWHCPYCQGSWGYAKGTEARLREELDAERRRKADALSRLNEAEQAKTKLERKLKRVGRGICPECNRTFANLARHMNCKHSKPEGSKAP